MASSSDCNTTPRRGFVPPQDEAERFLFRRVEELARRAEDVLGDMLHRSRSLAAAGIAAGKVELNHLPLRSAQEPVFAGDLFTVRGAGRWRVKAIGGKSRKDRIFITFFQY